MQLNLDVRYMDEKGNVFCFMHAVQQATKGVKIIPEIDEFGGGYDMRDTTCRECFHPNSFLDEG